jgi:hypothetical protein
MRGAQLDEKINILRNCRQAWTARAAARLEAIAPPAGIPRRSPPLFAMRRLAAWRQDEIESVNRPARTAPRGI